MAARSDAAACHAAGRGSRTVLPPASADRMPSPSSPPHVAVIGGGPAGLMAAEMLGQSGLAVTVYDQMPSVGRKFLMAGRGGLNLTPARISEHFTERYAEARPHLPAPARGVPPGRSAGLVRGGAGHLRGVERADFPQDLQGVAPVARLAGAARAARRGLQAAPPLAGLGREAASSLPIRPARRSGRSPTRPSWPRRGQLARLGSDGTWTPLLAERGIAVSPLRPSNMGFIVSGQTSCAAVSRGNP